jgi:hypothetical protein
MLVCNVSQVSRRAQIAAGIAEAAAALDALSTGIVLAALVDDPAAVVDHVDAYSGEIMIETAAAADFVTAPSTYAVAVAEVASAADTIAAGSSYTVAIVEAASAIDTITCGVGYAAAITEAGTANDAPDAYAPAAIGRQSILSSGVSPVFVSSTANREAVVAGGVTVNER